MVNPLTASVDDHALFGGAKGSSYGPHERSRYACEFHARFKTAYIG